jgi:nicotinic acid mononucleotide adenylyltransferase
MKKLSEYTGAATDALLEKLSNSDLSTYDIMFEITSHTTSMEKRLRMCQDALETIQKNPNVNAGELIRDVLVATKL